MNRKIRNKVNTLLRFCKARYISDLAENMKNDSSKFWRSISHLSRKSLATTIEPSHSADEFNKHFLTIPHKIVSGLDVSNVDPISYVKDFILSDIPSIHFQHVDPQEVYHLIGALESKKATGADNIPTSVIKLLTNSLVTPITTIINKSIDQSTVPTAWKAANVRPTQKSVKDTSLLNYRPISVLPILSKLLERVIQQQMLDHLDLHSLLYQHQYGFRPNHSTQDALIHITRSP